MFKFGPNSIFSSDRKALLILFFISFVYFLENFDRSLISVSPIPYIDYGSYEYSVLAGPAFTIVYTLGGVVFALLSYTDEPAKSKKESNAASTSKFNILSVATLIFSVAFICTALALYFWQQVIVRVVMGLAQSIITPFSTSIISDYFPPVMRGAAFGIFNIGTYFSFSLALSLGIYIYVEYGWQAGYFLFGMIGVFCAFVMPVFSFCQRARHDANSKSFAETAAAADITNGNTFPNNPMYRSSLHAEDRDRDLTAAVDISSGIGTGASRHHLDSMDFAPTESTTTNGGSSGGYASATSTGARADGAGAASLREKSEDALLYNKDEYECSGAKKTDSKVWKMAYLVYDICMVKWRQQPGIYLLCLATGVRIGAGYVWVAYTGAFYSDLFETDTDADACNFSYNAAYAAGAPGDVCSSDFPYCVSEECSQLTSFPWHNKVR